MAHYPYVVINSVLPTTRINSVPILVPSCEVGEGDALSVMDVVASVEERGSNLKRADVRHNTAMHVGESIHLGQAHLQLHDWTA
jgi:hypothetical protein